MISAPDIFFDLAQQNLREDRLREQFKVTAFFSHFFCVVRGYRLGFVIVAAADHTPTIPSLNRDRFADLCRPFAVIGCASS